MKAKNCSALLRLLIPLSCLTYLSLGQYQCPGYSFVKICDQCPNQCSGPTLGSSCARNAPDASYLKCNGASWGNTLTTYMDLSCSAPPGVRDQYPIIPILSPVYSAPIVCNGTILRGLWPYDEDNMTFSIDTMYRDPHLAQQLGTAAANQTTGVLNSIYLGCLQLRFRPLAAFSETPGSIGELAACTLTPRDITNVNYLGLNVMVCVNTNPTLDPTCQQGNWITVINGACLQENVLASVALQDYGDRLLIRVGGPGNLTACQTSWELDIDRTAGVCFSTDEGYGSCCQLGCVYGVRRTQTCFCDCTPGFTGIACDLMLPYIEVQLELSNTTVSDWLAFSHAETLSVQADNIYSIRSVFAGILGLEVKYIEFAWAEGPNARRADQSSWHERGRERAGRRTLLEDSGCAKQNFGNRVTTIYLRVVQSFEHNLFAINRKLQRGQGNITTGLATRNVHVCLVKLSTQAFTTYASIADLTPPQVTPPGGIDQTTILLAVCVTLGVIIVLIFVALHFCTEYVEQRDRTRYLREYKPIVTVHMQGNPWRHEDPGQRLLIAYPGDVSSQLQKGFMDGWIGRGESTFQFSYRDKDYEADFATMTVKETPREGEIVDVPDSCSVRLDARASAANQQYDGFTLVITAAPPGTDPEVVNQRRKIVSYLGGRARLVTVANPFLPVPTTGCRYKLEWPGAAAYRLVPPGLELEDAAAMAIVPSRNPKLQEQILRRAHAAAKSRIDKYVYYPNPDPPPAAALHNLPKLVTMHGRDLQLRKAEAEAARGLSFRPAADEGGITAGQLRQWQRKEFSSAARGDKLYNEMMERVRASRPQLDPQRQLLDRAFRSEIFEPGSSVRVVCEDTPMAPPPEPTALQAMKQWRLRSLIDPTAPRRGATAAADRRLPVGLGPRNGEDLSYLNALPEGRAVRRDGVEEEVAV